MKQHESEIVNQLYCEFTKRARSLDQYRWQWMDTPFGPGDSWVVEDRKTGNIVGHHGLMRLFFSQAGIRKTVGKTENTFIIAEHKKKMYYPGLEKKALMSIALNYDYLYSASPQKNRGAIGKLRNRLGYRRIGNLYHALIHVRPQVLSSLITQDMAISPLLAILAASAYSFFATTLAVFRTFFTRGYRLKVLPWNLAGDYARFWDDNKCFHSLTPDRSKSYLIWRFADNPNISYRLIKFMYQEDDVGYAVVHRQSLKLGDIRITALFIDDLIAKNASPLEAHRCLLQLVRYYRKEPAIFTQFLDNQRYFHQAVNKLLWPATRYLTKMKSGLDVWSRNGTIPELDYTNMMTEGVK